MSDGVNFSLSSKETEQKWLGEKSYHVLHFLEWVALKGQNKILSTFWFS